MSQELRIEAAAGAAAAYCDGGWPAQAYEGEVEAALAAADAVMFSDEAIERAARELFPTYWDPEFYHEHSEVTGKLAEESQQACIQHVRAVVTALKGDA